MAIDPKKFNEDPKHEKERENFDALLEGGINRLAERKKKAGEPPAEKGFFDELLDLIK